MGCYHGNEVGNCLGCEVSETTQFNMDHPLVVRVGELQLQNRKLQRDLAAATMFEFKGDELYFVEQLGENSLEWDVSHMDDRGETIHHAEGVSRDEALTLGRKLAKEDDV